LVRRMDRATIHLEARGHADIGLAALAGSALCGRQLHVHAMTDAVCEVTCLGCLRIIARYEQMSLPLP